MSGERMTDSEVALMVRMLMRDQLDHEMVCTLARDRIMALSYQLSAERKRREEAEKELAEEKARRVEVQMELNAAYYHGVAARSKP